MSQHQRAVRVVGPDTFATLGGVARAFARLGWQTSTSAYSFARSARERWLLRLSGRVRSISSRGLRPLFEARWFNQFLRSEVLPELTGRPPRLLVFLLPFRLEPDTRVALANLGCPIVTWATDSLARYGRFAGRWDIAVRNYVFDGADATGTSDKWLPLGFEEDVYRPGDRIDWDVLFVGRIYARLYQGRLNFLRHLVLSELPGKRRVALVGSVVRQHRALKRRFEERGGVCLGDLDISELGLAIGRARIAICVHQDDGRQPINPLFFAIPGCRTCLVTDSRDYLAHWLRPGVDFVGVGPDEFIPILGRLLQDDTERARLAGQGFLAAGQHTWLARVQTILGDLQIA